MNRRFSWVAVGTVILAVAIQSYGLAPENERETMRQDVEQVVVDAYILGIHGTQDEKQVKAGFHESFRMLVPEGEAVRPVSVDEWLAFIEESKQTDPETWKAKTTYTFDSVDVTDNAASVKIQVYKDKKHFSTDYMLLYRFTDGWKIVSKIFKMY